MSKMSELFALRDQGLLDGEPCNHPGCLSHVSHPCEGCGRVAGRRLTSDELESLYDIQREDLAERQRKDKQEEE